MYGFYSFTIKLNKNWFIAELSKRKTTKNLKLKKLLKK